MKKKLMISAMLMALTFFWLPGEGNNSVSAQRQSRKVVRVFDDDRGKHKGTWRKKNSHGYRNYGQYRRTQVGNRRYRLVKRPYWSDGVRRVRLTRVYY